MIFQGTRDRELVNYAFSYVNSNSELLDYQLISEGTITLLTYYYLIRSGTLAGGLPDFRKDFGASATQIKIRKWQKLTKPNLNVGYSLVREFYANAWRTDVEKKSPPPYTTQVRGAEISFAPDDIRRVFKLRETPLPNAPSYHDRKANNDLRLEEVSDCLCEEGAQWVLHRDGRPHFLRRTDLQPMARGWYEFVCRSIIPTTNHSEVIVERAVLIHSIIIGEDIRVEEIIASNLQKCEQDQPSVQASIFRPHLTLMSREESINSWRYINTM
ncbi:hypothetical protein PIB30_062277 [Stylosanthes scabra]|uniref:Putative plant transposon protein domain-containing protein n=1 Tax=Stylosanthes scabra TaxID=79078 RepID=A0ABU6RL25_9FABA|nr:hypothetical protein [Stylosanthes scabra]